MEPELNPVDPMLPIAEEIPEPKKSPVLHRYWMAKEAKKVISALSDYDDNLLSVGRNPFYDMWYRNSYAYYSTVLDAQSISSSLNFQGEQGELVKMSVPEARSLIQDVLTLSTKQKLNFRAIMKRDGSKYIDATRKANALLDAKSRNGELNRVGRDALENGLLLGTGFLGNFWRFDRGPQLAENEKGGVVHAGESEIVSLHPADIVMDYRIENFEDQPWVRVRFKRNRYDLLAMYPELEKAIMALPSCHQVDQVSREEFQLVGEDDQVYEYCVIHKQTPALPFGRFLCYSSVDAVYYDDDSIYPLGIPIVPIIPEPVKGYGLGYPLLSSLLPAQEMLDHEFSVTATNHSALGLRNVLTPSNSGLDVARLDGMSLITYKPQDIPGGGKPELLRFDAPHNDFYEFSDRLQGSMQRMSKLNDAVRGEIAASASGVAIATLTTNALEFLSNYSGSLYSGLEKILFYDVALNRRMVKDQRTINYGVGSQTSQMAELKWSGSDLDAVQGIGIVAVNPMMQTIAGRVDIADKMIDKQLVTDVKEYFAILDGAPPERMWENELSEDDLLASIKEALLAGQVPPILSTDDHPRMIRYALSLLNDMEVRMEGQVTQTVLQFVQECFQQAMQANPVLLAMARTGKMPQMPPQMPPPGNGGDDGSGQMPVGEEMPTDMSPQAEPMMPEGGGTPALPQAEPADDLLGR